MYKKKWFNNAGSRWGRLGKYFFKTYDSGVYVTGIMHITKDIQESDIRDKRFNDTQESQVVKAINEIKQLEQNNRVVFSISVDNLKRILKNNADAIQFSVNAEINSLKPKGNIISKDGVIVIRYIDYSEVDNDDMTLVAPMKERTNIEDMF